VRVSIGGAHANGQLSGNVGSGKWNGASAAYRAAVDGSFSAVRHVELREPSGYQTADTRCCHVVRGICSGSASYAQSGPFAGMAGNWSGGGTVTLDDGSTERIRCRASYAVGQAATASI